MINYDYLIDKDYYKNEISQNSISNRKITYHEITDGLLLKSELINNSYSSGICDGVNIIEATSLHNTFDKNTINIEYEECLDETVVFVGAWVNCWGHWITDNISRLWFLQTDDYKKYKNCKLAYIPLSNNFSISENCIQLLKKAGVKIENLYQINKTTKVKKIIIPDESFYKDENLKFSIEYVNTIRLIKNSTNEYNSKYNKVYLTYSGFSLDNEIGEQKLEKFFHEQGYLIISPEQYSFEEQLIIYNSCKYFAATIGSISHNLIFLNENTNVILIPRANYLTDYQVALNQIKELNISYIDSSYSLFVNQRSPHAGPFYYYVSDKLVSYFQTKDKSECPIKKMDFYLYNKLSIEKNDFSGCINPNCYYKNKHIEYIKKSRYNIIFRLFRKIKLYKKIAIIVNTIRNKRKNY